MHGILSIGIRLKLCEIYFTNFPRGIAFPPPQNFPRTVKICIKKAAPPGTAFRFMYMCRYTGAPHLLAKARTLSAGMA